jgi:hypothetical protein
MGKHEPLIACRVSIHWSGTLGDLRRGVAQWKSLNSRSPEYT